MSDAVKQPAHYKSHPSGIETIEITRHESFLRGNVLKYVLRAPYKGSELEDLEKARVYLDWEIERLKAYAAADDALKRLAEAQQAVVERIVPLEQ